MLTVQFGCVLYKACYLGLPENCLCDPNTWKMNPIANSSTNRPRKRPLAQAIS